LVSGHSELLVELTYSRVIRFLTQW